MADKKAKTTALDSPVEQLMVDMKTTPDDAAYIAQFLDISVVVNLFRRHKYNAETKIERLMEIVTKGTYPQQMQAMDRLDAIYDQAMVRRGILTGGTTQALPPGMPASVGLPSSIQSVEMISKQVRMTVGTQAEEPAPQPLKEIDDEQEDTAEEDGAYYRDDRGESANIFRPATVELGQETRI